MPGDSACPEPVLVDVWKVSQKIKAFFFFFELLALSACLSKKQKEEEKVAKEDTQGQQL